MRKRAGKISMAAMMVLTFSAIILIMLSTTLGFYIRYYKDSTFSTAGTTGTQTVRQTVSTVNTYISDMEAVMEVLMKYMVEKPERRDAFIADFLALRPEVVDVAIYDRRGKVLNCWSYDHELKDEITENLSFESVEYTSGYFLSSPHVVTILEGYYPWAVTLCAPLSSGRWVLMDFNFANISEYLNNIGIGKHGYCFIMDKEGELVYHPQQQLIYAGLKSEDTSLIRGYEDGSYISQNYIYSVQSAEGCDWRIVGVSYVEEMIDESVLNATRMATLIAGVVLLVAVFITIVLTQAITRPLKRLGNAMQEFEAAPDDFIYEPEGSLREVRTLSNSFEHMATRVQQLMEQVREEEINLRKTELKALQAQINPHFLYNTLDSIAWMCERGKTADASNMVKSLAMLFRISISHGKDIIPIEQELIHAKSYLEIQKIRYKNRFEYYFDVDEECKNYLCNKITLQPFIENAINHGLNQMLEEGEIRIGVHVEGDDIVMSVEDNGVGMAPEKVQSILSAESLERRGIGVKNVNDRLKIYFGEGYGVSIESEQDEGTKVFIRMPKLTEEPHEKA